MRRKPGQHSASKRGESLLLRAGRGFHRFCPLTGFRGVRLLFILALMWVAPSMALGQGSHTNRTVVSPQGGGSRSTEGAIITTNRITLKPGYKFTRVSANKIAVRRKNDSGINVEATCACSKRGGTGCFISEASGVMTCKTSKSGSCAECKWTKVTVNQNNTAIQ